MVQGNRMAYLMLFELHHKEELRLLEGLVRFMWTFVLQISNPSNSVEYLLSLESLQSFPGLPHYHENGFDKRQTPL